MKIKHLLLPALVAFIPSFAMAEDCAVTVTGNDSMQFDTKAITIGKACTKFTVNLKHSGKLAKNVMGHNWVLTKTEDSQAVATEGVSAGVDKSYVKDGDARVIAHTTLIGGGESTSVTFPVDKIAKGGSYTFFCSFPGHIALMKGTVTRE
ncbi:azurin [Cellvibrio zantedeschiae]|uniref:Azurin n=1 Tax=Cellvibrio zantedeschiae TaxID=1237077 RepID=A0ABQ3B3C7_9GAMM|nr:azurin [Cellvibrio zantedeschiae]GGY77971.1 azurin [Cellvibrio zantedeschiae]